MLTRCPACTTHFRVTPEQLKVRTGRVRCGECQHVFNALDSLIEEPVAVPLPMAAVAVPPMPTFEPVSEAFEAIAPQAVEPVADEPGPGQLPGAEAVTADADATTEALGFMPLAKGVVDGR